MVQGNCSSRCTIPRLPLYGASKPTDIRTLPEYQQYRLLNDGDFRDPSLLEFHARRHCKHAELQAEVETWKSKLAADEATSKIKHAELQAEVETWKRTAESNKARYLDLEQRWKSKHEIDSY